MIRIAARSLAACLAACVVVACAPTAQAPTGSAFDGARSTDSPIAGETLRCAGDYPDSVLVFARDGTLSGRYAGEEVTGEWNAVEPGQVEVLLRAGAIAVRDTIRQTRAGWRGENTACG